MENPPVLPAGTYRHKSNGKLYLLGGYIRSHESGEAFVLYTPLYVDPKHTGPAQTFTTIKRWQESFSYNGPYREPAA